MKRINRIGFAGVLLAASFAADAAEVPADTVYRNGKIYTVDAADSVHQALAVRDGRIVYVGDAGVPRRSSAREPVSSTSAAG